MDKRWLVAVVDAAIGILASTDVVMLSFVSMAAMADALCEFSCLPNLARLRRFFLTIFCIAEAKLLV